MPGILKTKNKIISMGDLRTMFIHKMNRIVTALMIALTTMMLLTGCGTADTIIQGEKNYE